MKPLLVAVAVGAVALPAGLFGYEKLVGDISFAPGAQLKVLDVQPRPTRVGTFGETIKADPGYVFQFARVRLMNNGTIDLSAATWQFSAVDAQGSETAAALANAHDDFDGSRLRAGGVRDGTVIFQMEEGAALRAVIWQGDLAAARGTWP